jgi:hypothetical protein
VRRFDDYFSVKTSITLQIQKSSASFLRLEPQTDNSFASGLVFDVGLDKRLQLGLGLKIGFDQRPQIGLVGLGERTDELFPR